MVEAFKILVHVMKSARLHEEPQAVQTTRHKLQGWGAAWEGGGVRSQTLATHRRTRYFAPQRMQLHDCAPILRGRPRGMHLLPPRVVLAALQLLPRLGKVDARAVHGLL